jgi:hypothetical protein
MIVRFISRFLPASCAGFHPITTSALHGASVSFAIKKSARAEILAGRARAFAVTKYSPPSGKRQSVRSGSTCALTLRDSLPNQYG